MSKRLCKYNRRDIADSLGTIHSLVTEARYLCRSCARSSATSESLCKPSAIPPKNCQAKSVEEKETCGLLVETLPKKSKLVVASAPVQVETTSNNAKKTAKKQKKYQKKLEKLLKKQKKLLKKHKAIEKQFSAIRALTSVDEASNNLVAQLH